MADDRVYKNDNGQWFFRIRGKQDIGPFDTQAKATEMLDKRVTTWSDRTSPNSPWPRSWRPRIFRRSATRQP
jgi:hypothetical protein